MPWKKDDSGVLAVDTSGNPVWISESGEESGADYGLTIKRLGEVNAESKKRKEELRALREKFAALDGIEDVAAYRQAADKALEAAKNQPEKDKELEAQIAGRVEAATSGYKNQITERDKKLAEQDKKNQELQNELNRLKVGVCVKGSKTLAQRLAPEDRVLMERELIRAGFISEDGKVQFRDDAGEVYLNDKYEPCSADEAVIAIMKKLGIDPDKKLLSLDNANGSGGLGSTAGLPGQKNPWKKEFWNVTGQCRIMKDNPAMAKSRWRRMTQTFPAMILPSNPRLTKSPAAQTRQCARASTSAGQAWIWSCSSELLNQESLVQDFKRKCGPALPAEPHEYWKYLVPRDRIELPTQGFSVPRSTN